MIKTEISQKEYNSKIKLIKKHPITCTGCGRYLGNIVETSGSEQLNNDFLIKNKKHLCVCPCGDECFVITTNTASSVLLEGKYRVDDMVCDNVKNINHVKIGVEK